MVEKKKFRKYLTKNGNYNLEKLKERKAELGILVMCEPPDLKFTHERELADIIELIRRLESKNS